MFSSPSAQSVPKVSTIFLNFKYKLTIFVDGLVGIPLPGSVMSDNFLDVIIFETFMKRLTGWQLVPWPYERSDFFLNIASRTKKNIF